jgi:membrane protease YdiL (CAAX protease family)
MRSGTFFINEFGRIRSGWRAMIFVIPFFVATLALTALATVFLLAVGISIKENYILVLAIGNLVTLASALLFGWLCGKYLEALPFRALGAWFTEGWLKHLMLGLALGAVTIGVAVAIPLVSGALTFTVDIANSREAIAKSLLVSLGIFIVAAASEEAFFRGYVLQTLNRAGYGLLAIIVTSAFFGVFHLLNPEPTLISTTNTALAGVWFGFAYLKTRDLWFPFGIHLIWNWMQGSIFGIEVSGLTKLSPAPVLNEIDRGPAWLTGEHYGIEGSIACTIAILISIALIYFLPRIQVDKEMLAMTSHESNKS